MRLSIEITFVALIVVVIVLVVFRDVFWYLRSLKYKKQGIPIRYFPLSGFNKYMDSPKKNALADFVKLFQSTKHKNQTEDLILINNGSSRPLIFINSKDLVKEYHQKETQVTYKEDMFGFPGQNTFVFSKDMHLVKNARAMFSEIFSPENLRKQTPRFKAFAQRRFNQIRDEVKRAQAKGNKLPEIELKRFTKYILTDFLNYVLFGDEFPELDSKPLIDQIEYLIEEYFFTEVSPENILTLGLSTKLGFDSEYNKAKLLFDRVVQKVKQVIRERENNKNYQFGCNTVDLLILKNRELEAQGKTELVMTREQIVDNIFMMVFTGVETSRSLTDGCFFKLSRDQALQQQLRESVRKEVLDTGNGDVFDKYDQSELLERFIKESLRLWPPVPITPQRKIAKTFKLGPYTLYKGDYISLSLMTLMIKPEVWNQPMKFDLKKYEDKKRINELSNSAYAPFNAGKRSCIGRNLADIMIRLILCNFLDQFELYKSNKPNRRFMVLTFGLEHCNVRLRCIQ